MTVGMLRIPYSVATLGLSSVFSLSCAAARHDNNRVGEGEGWLGGGRGSGEGGRRRRREATGRGREAREGGGTAAAGEERQSARSLSASQQAIPGAGQPRGHAQPPTAMRPYTDSNQNKQRHQRQQPQARRGQLVPFK